MLTRRTLLHSLSGIEVVVLRGAHHRHRLGVDAILGRADGLMILLDQFVLLVKLMNLPGRNDHRPACAWPYSIEGDLVEAEDLEKKLLEVAVVGAVLKSETLHIVVVLPELNYRNVVLRGLIKTYLVGRRRGALLSRVCF